MIASFRYMLLFVGGLLVFQLPRFDIEPFVKLWGNASNTAFDAWCAITNQPNTRTLAIQQQQQQSQQSQQSQKDAAPVATASSIAPAQPGASSSSSSSAKSS